MFHRSGVLSFFCLQVQHPSAPEKTSNTFQGIKRTFEADQSRSPNKFELEAPQESSQHRTHHSPPSKFPVMRLDLEVGHLPCRFPGKSDLALILTQKPPSKENAEASLGAAACVNGGAFDRSASIKVNKF